MVPMLRSQVTLGACAPKPLVATRLGSNRYAHVGAAALESYVHNYGWVCMRNGIHVSCLQACSRGASRMRHAFVRLTSMTGICHFPDGRGFSALAMLAVRSTFTSADAEACALQHMHAPHAHIQKHAPCNRQRKTGQARMHAHMHTHAWVWQS